MPTAMYDLLTDPLPTEWEGRSINWDFRPMVRLLNELRRSGSEEESSQSIARALNWFYPEPVAPEDLPEAFQSLLRFAQGGTDEETAAAQSEARGDGTGEPVLDYHYDAEYLLGAFQQAYGIDLTVDKVHWWRFKALLRALPPETPLGHILDFRGADTSEMDDAHRQYYERNQERYALPPELKGVKHSETLQEHEAAFLDRF